MPIQKSGQFFFWDDAPWCPSLGIETDKLQSCIAAIKENKYYGVFGCPVFGFKQDNLDFLRDIPHIRYTHFWEVNLKNIQGLYSLENLEFFSVCSKRPHVDFSKFSKLERIIWYHNKKDVGISTLKHLRKLDLWRYKQPSYKDLEITDSLEYLEINWSSAENLKDFPVLKSLKELQFHYCRNLESLRGISDITPNLEKLVITRCNKCTDVNEIFKLPLINHAWINKKLI